MKIAIIDADLLGRQRHRFPNLACEKISGYWKEQGATVELKLDYEFCTRQCTPIAYVLFGRIWWESRQL